MVPMTFIIAISNEKGGVAKTTTTLSLGAALVECGQRVLLMDMDPQGNLTLALGLTPATLDQVIGNSLLENDPLENAIIKSDTENLHIIPTNRHLEEAEQLLPAMLGYTKRLREVIERADINEYDLILIDCPPSLGAITINALTAADLLIIPTQAEYLSAYALRDMMTLIRQIRADSNSDLAYLVLITMFDKRNRTHRNIQEQLKNTFEKGLLKTIIETDTKLRESPILGVPITKYKPSSRGAMQYRQLAEELLEYVQKTT